MKSVSYFGWIYIFQVLWYNKTKKIYRAEVYDSEGKLGVNRRSEARTAAKKLWLISEDQ